MGWDRVPYGLPRLGTAGRQGEPPRKALGHGKLPVAQEPGSMRGFHEKHVPSLLGGRGSLGCTPIRREDGWEHRVLPQYSGVLFPGPRVPEILTWGITLELGFREVGGAVHGGVRPQHIRRFHSGPPEWGRSQEQDLERSGD